ERPPLRAGSPPKRFRVAWRSAAGPVSAGCDPSSFRRAVGFNAYAPRGGGGGSVRPAPSDGRIGYPPPGAHARRGEAAVAIFLLTAATLGHRCSPRRPSSL